MQNIEFCTELILNKNSVTITYYLLLKIPTIKMYFFGEIL